MDAHEELLRWATGRGVKLNGIAPKRIPGRGIGLVATRDIQPEEVVLEVPTAALRSAATVPAAVKRALGATTSVHGLLAADLALDASPTYAAWNAVCPSPAELASVPMAWPAGLQALLPGPAAGLLARQQRKYGREWEAVRAAFSPSSSGDDDDDVVDEERFRHAWTLVNTRTFYYADPRQKRRGNRGGGGGKHDNMCLQPVADLFNHADADADAGGCHVAYDAAGYSVKARRGYGGGEELKICYGRHNGDVLLVEYGFVMDEENRWDEIALDEVLVPRLGARQKEQLEEAGFLGRYVLDRETECYRTQVALRLLCCRGAGEWRRFVDGLDDGEASQAKVDELLLELLREYKDTARERIGEVQKSAIGLPEQRAVLKARWEQVLALIERNISRIQQA
ncbi:SET domain-containing protein [Xylariomycetidae sp. FL0641]|nr:SET domain-containing protein [Xylariomycetidae sp. FL0641]